MRTVETVVLLVALATVVAAFAGRAPPTRGTKRPSPGFAWPKRGSPA